MNLDRLAATVRSKLRDGRLPVSEPGKVYAGYGRGLLCSACEEAIEPTQVEYEFDERDRTYRFHPACHAIWQAERRLLQ